MHPDLDKHAVVSDEAGMLHHVLLHGSHFTTDSVYQLQYGTELLYQGTEVSEVPCMIERQWSSLQFVPNRTGGILFHQSGSTKLLYTILPDAKTVSSPVLMFGSHTGQQLCFPHRPDSLLGTYAVLTTTCWLRSLQAAGNSVTSFRTKASLSGDSACRTYHMLLSIPSWQIHGLRLRCWLHQAVESD